MKFLRGLLTYFVYQRAVVPRLMKEKNQVKFRQKKVKIYLQTYLNFFIYLFVVFFFNFSFFMVVIWDHHWYIYKYYQN